MIKEESGKRVPTGAGGSLSASFLFFVWPQDFSSVILSPSVPMTLKRAGDRPLASVFKRFELEKIVISFIIDAEIINSNKYCNSNPN